MGRGWGAMISIMGREARSEKQEARRAFLTGLVCIGEGPQTTVDGLQTVVYN